MGIFIHCERETCGHYCYDHLYRNGKDEQADVPFEQREGVPHGACKRCDCPGADYTDGGRGTGDIRKILEDMARLHNG